MLCIFAMVILLCALTIYEIVKKSVLIIMAFKIL
jgi:hypothetical protein